MSDTSRPALSVTGIAEICASARRIAPYVRRTPLVSMPGSGLWLKAESLHPAGSFKIRGAFNSILCLDEAHKARGVVAHSSGNHAIAVAYAAAQLGVRATVVMPVDAPAIKRQAVERWGAGVVEAGVASSERRRVADRLSAEQGLTSIPPYDSPLILAATGTIGLEICEDLDAVETVFAPVSGGGLIAGIAIAIKLLRPSVRVIGVEPANAADGQASLRAGRIVEFSAEHMARTIADGLRVQSLGDVTWPVIKSYVDEIVTVSEADIAQAMALIAHDARLVAEPSGAVAAAGALASAYRHDRSVAVLSGGNVDPRSFLNILERHCGGR